MQPTAVLPAVVEPPPRSGMAEDELAQGSYVKIVSGKYQGMQGSVVEIQERKSGTVVKVKADAFPEIFHVWHDEVQPAPHIDALFKSWLRPHIRTVFSLKLANNQQVLLRWKILQPEMCYPRCHFQRAMHCAI